MHGLLFLSVALIAITLFSLIVYYVIDPFFKQLYYTYEPLLFHYVFKITCLKKKVDRKLAKTYLKVKIFWVMLWHRK